MDEQIAVLAVADRGSFEAAGKYLGVGRSAIRKRIQGVENELGTSIFYSSRSRGMVPTEAGKPVSRRPSSTIELGPRHSLQT